jgi:hypothetical protein
MCWKMACVTVVLFNSLPDSWTQRWTTCHVAYTTVCEWKSHPRNCRLYDPLENTRYAHMSVNGRTACSFVVRFHYLRRFKSGQMVEGIWGYALLCKLIYILNKKIHVTELCNMFLKSARGVTVVSNCFGLTGGSFSVSPSEFKLAWLIFCYGNPEYLRLYFVNPI